MNWLRTIPQTKNNKKGINMNKDIDIDAEFQKFEKISEELNRMAEEFFSKAIDIFF